MLPPIVRSRLEPLYEWSNCSPDLDESQCIELERIPDRQFLCHAKQNWREIG
jgi:hypothetical protein